MADPTPEMVQQDNWFVLLDPDWQPGTSTESPPADAIVGGWRMLEDDTIGPFEPNPVYTPRSESTPTDPVDALLRLIASGRLDLGDDLIARIRDSVIEIGCDAADQMLVGVAPDGAPCIPVVTAAVHKQSVDIEHWVPVLGAMLPEVVPPGIDILLNPGGSAQFRLITSALRPAR